MNRFLIFEGKTTFGGQDVDLKIYRIEDEDGKYYEWDYNPYVVDETQADVHKGEINRALDLDTLFFRINEYKNEIRKIKEIKANINF